MARRGIDASGRNGAITDRPERIPAGEAAFGRIARSRRPVLVRAADPFLPQAVPQESVRMRFLRCILAIGEHSGAQGNPTLVRALKSEYSTKKLPKSGKNLPFLGFVENGLNF